MSDSKFECSYCVEAVVHVGPMVMDEDEVPRLAGSGSLIDCNSASSSRVSLGDCVRLTLSKDGDRDLYRIHITNLAAKLLAPSGKPEICPGTRVKVVTYLTGSGLKRGLKSEMALELEPSVSPVSCVDRAPASVYSA